MILPWCCSSELGAIVDSKKLEHGCRMVYADCPSFLGLGLEVGHVPNFWLLLYFSAL